MSEKNIHLGVYGLCVKKNEILMIKKIRGPYSGLYDLPGGKIEFGETIKECLEREIREETGAKVKNMKFLKINEHQCRYIKNGMGRMSHHIGIYYLVELSIERLKNFSDGEDSGGAVWLQSKKIQRNNMAPISYSIIVEYLKSAMISE